MPSYSRTVRSAHSTLRVLQSNFPTGYLEKLYTEFLEDPDWHVASDDDRAASDWACLCRRDRAEWSLPAPILADGVNCNECGYVEFEQIRYVDDLEYVPRPPARRRARVTKAVTSKRENFERPGEKYFTLDINGKRKRFYHLKFARHTIRDWAKALRRMRDVESKSNGQIVKELLKKLGKTICRKYRDFYNMHLCYYVPW